MKVLILGGSGMLGHKLWQLCSARFDTYVTFRRQWTSVERFGLFEYARSIESVDAGSFESVERALDTVRPDVVINCVGIIKQAPEAKDPVRSISINALFPHQLANACRSSAARLIHISTDCVFDGKDGRYRETDAASAVDLYGRTKHLGEVTEAGCLTLRTSIVGRELEGASGLFEWFLAQRGKCVSGYRRAIFSGLTTRALGEIIATIIDDHPRLEGLYHVASDPISKYDLLTMVNDAYSAGVSIEPDDVFHCDRSLNGSRFVADTGIQTPSWPSMIADLRSDPTPYSELRSSYVIDR